MALVNWRTFSLWPPLNLFLLTRALPSGLRGPVDCSHGFQVRISSACLALRSGVQPLAMMSFQ